MTPDRAACALLIVMFLVALVIHGCASPPTARELCAAPPTSRLWDKACEGMYKPRRPPEGLCSDPDGRGLWPNDWDVRCEGK